MNKVVVVGGGAAGMMAAIAAAKQGALVHLVEKNEKLGKKIYITGKGRCNVTNNSDVEDFLKNIPRNWRFLYSALYTYPPDNTMRDFEKNGCALKTERGNRVFPVSEKASDITKALKKQLEQLKVEVQYHQSVAKLMVQSQRVVGIITQQGEEIPAKAVIIATGGKSYPVTGSTGDGYILAEQVGHQIIPPLPALVPLTTTSQWPLKLQGLSLKNITLIGEKKGKKKFQHLGEMLFTHFGFSGPLILEISSHIQGENLDDWTFYIDLKPGLTSQQVKNRILRDFESNPNKEFLTILQGLLPSRLAKVFGEELGLPIEKPINQITKEEREKIEKGLKSFPLPITGFRSFDEAVITRGGGKIGEINPSTMESKLCKNLFFAGEVMDVDGYTGGYNLQIAFSTGFLAGQEAAKCNEIDDKRCVDD